MAQSIRAQALLLLLALGLGAGLGLLYDLLRPLRRRTGDALWDLLFCAAAAFGCFCFAMRSENGRLGSGELAVSLAGFCLYTSLLSPAVAPRLEFSARALGGFWIIMGLRIKKYRISQKNSFKIRARELSYYSVGRFRHGRKKDADPDRAAGPAAVRGGLPGRAGTQGAGGAGHGPGAHGGAQLGRKGKPCGAAAARRRPEHGGLGDARLAAAGTGQTGRDRIPLPAGKR
ncbi:MAG: hypothetical protein K6F56_06585 [Oscillospiraceae bacterium]|nr:hypothetical protein [Oscillospiraceae bacterium]